MSRVIFTAILCLLSLGSMAFAAEFPDCGSKVGSYSAVRVSGCTSASATCDLIRETNATIEVDFTTAKPINKVNAVVHGVILDVPVPFPLPHADACAFADSGLSCPLSQGTAYTYRTSMYIEKKFPKISLKIKFELQDENNEDIVCMMIPARIKSA